MNGACALAAIAGAVLVSGCGQGGQSPAMTAPASTPRPTTSAFTVTFGENPAPFRSTGCNGSVPQGWYTTASIQETAGVSFTPGALTQKVDGSAAAFLSESFASRFGACGGVAFTPGVIAANSQVCGLVGVCSANPYRNYQFEVTGTDANGHALTVTSPLLQLRDPTGTQ
jgi:hypothetical protein